MVFLLFDGSGDDAEIDAGFVFDTKRNQPEQSWAAQPSVPAQAKHDSAFVFSRDSETGQQDKEYNERRKANEIHMASVLRNCSAGAETAPNCDSAWITSFTGSNPHSRILGAAAGIVDVMWGSLPFPGFMEAPNGINRRYGRDRRLTGHTLPFLGVTVQGAGQIDGIGLPYGG